MNKKITSVIIVSVMILGLGLVGGVLAYPSRIENESLWTGPNDHTASCHGGGVNWQHAVNGTVTTRAMINETVITSVQKDTKFNISVSIANFTDVWYLPDRNGFVGIAAAYVRGDNDEFVISPAFTFEVQLDAYGSLDNFNITFFSPSIGGVYTIIITIFNGMNYTGGSALAFIYIESSLTLSVTPLPPVSSILGYIILAIAIVGVVVAVPAIVLLRRRTGKQKKPII